MTSTYQIIPIDSNISLSGEHVKWFRFNTLNVIISHYLIPLEAALCIVAAIVFCFCVAEAKKYTHQIRKGGSEAGTAFIVEQ